MWVICGPFDSKTLDTPSEKQKLLKPGREYGLGRRGNDLEINHLKISHKHLKFVIGKHTEVDAITSKSIPNIRIFNLRDRARNIRHPNGDVSQLAAHGDMDLQDGDEIHVISGVTIRITWIDIYCLLPPPKDSEEISIQACASLGLNITYTPSAEVTHHFISNYALTPMIAISLISSAHLVRPEWLIEVIHLGDSTTLDPSKLEQHFVLPPLTKYRPSFSPVLPSSLKSYRPWEPNEARLHMFAGQRFVFVGEKGREITEELREMVRRAGGEYECFSVENGRSTWHQVLAKGQGKGKTLVLVADDTAMSAAVGTDKWGELVQEAESFQFQLLPPAKLTQAVVHVDLAYVNSRLSAENDGGHGSETPDVILNTCPDEPSLAPPEQPEPAQSSGPSRRRLLPRRATSRASSRAPSPPPIPLQEEKLDEPVKAPKPRKALTRRAGLPSAPILGIDDSIILDPPILGNHPEEKPNVPDPVVETTVPTQARLSRLKRRAGTAMQPPESSLYGAAANTQQAAEPPLKRFKALFDESDPDRIAQSGLEEYTSGASMSQLQPQSLTQNESTMTQSKQRAGALTQLPVLAEEEEEHTPSSGTVTLAQTQTQGLKRKTPLVDEDVDMDGESIHKTKKRAMESVNAVIAVSTQKPSSKPVPTQKPSSKPVSRAVEDKNQKNGAAPGTHDKDEAFLKAVASTKRGKKTEDTFDREFNNLRISKPDLQVDQQHKEWAVLDDFDFDEDVRGNFMVVVPMDINERNDRDHALRRGSGRMDWVGKPDFKKFKKKVLGERRTPVELVIEDENDYGMGSQYWKGGSQTAARTHTQSDTLNFSPKKPPSRTARSQTQKGQTQKGKTRTFVVSESDDEVVGPAKNGSDTMTQSQRPARSRSVKQTQPLFIESDVDDGDDSIDNGDAVILDDGDDDEFNPRSEDEMTLRSAVRQTQESAGTGRSSGTLARPGKKKPTLILDDDSDDGATFKGFRGKRGKQ